MCASFVTSLHSFSKSKFKSTIYSSISRNRAPFSTPSLYHTNFLKFNYSPFSTNATHQHKIAQAEILHIDSAPPITPNEISNTAFPDHVLLELNKGFDQNEVEIKPDGIIYLPEIKYRRVLNGAFGAGGWVMIPRGAPAVRGDVLYREYAMYCYGKFVSQAVGEQQIHKSMSEGTAVEASKSNSLMRCCKDLGIASELWDPDFIESWKKTFATQVWCKNEKTGELKLMWRRLDRSSISYPWKEQNPLPPTNTKKYVAPRIPSPNPPQSNYSAPRKQSKYNVPQPIEEPIHHEAEEDIHNGVEEEGDSIPFDPNEEVPPSLKRFAGKTWAQLVEAQEGIPYLVWVTGHPNIQQEMREKLYIILDYYSPNWRDQIAQNSNE